MGTAIPSDKEFIEVSERGFPWRGVTYREGAVLLVPEQTAENACDEANPPFARRIPEDEALDRNLPAKKGLVEVEDEEPEPPEPGDPELPYRFTAGANGLLHDANKDPGEYDGPAADDGTVTEDHVRSWLSGGGGRPAPSQAARELAESEGVDLSEVEGTGKGGRVKKSDVEAHLSG